MRVLLILKNVVTFCVLVGYLGVISTSNIHAETPFNEHAQDILAETHFHGGLIVHLGCGDGKLTAALGARGDFLVHGLCADRQSVEKARAAVKNENFFGRVAVDWFDGEHLPYVNNLVDLLISENPGDVGMAEIMRVLRPLGTAYIKQDGEWRKKTKPRPKSIDDWTHFLHGADGNPVADDTVVGPPKHFQWVSGPRWLRSHDTDSSVSAVVASQEALYYFVDEAPISLPGQHDLPDKWFLTARNAFNGTLLWKIPVADWGWKAWKETWFLARPGDFPLNLDMRLVAANDKLYATLGYHAPVSEINAKSGEIVKTYKGTKETREILYLNGNLIVTVPVEPGAPFMTVKRIHAETGEVFWETKDAYSGTTTDYLRWRAMRGRVPDQKTDSVLNPVCDGESVAFIDGKEIVCLNYEDGAECWRTQIQEDKIKSLWKGAVIIHDGVVLYASRYKLVGLSAKNGDILWTQPKSYLGHLWYEWKDVFVIDGKAWTWSAELKREPYSDQPRKAVWPVAVNGYDLHSGELAKQVPLGNVFKTHHHHRCYRNKATVNYILASRRGTEYIDLNDGFHTIHNWVRGTCHYGMLPANGMQYAPPHPCRCYINEKLNGFLALAPARADESAGIESDRTNRLEKGPAHGKIKEVPAAPSDWPTYRNDPMRSGSSTNALPGTLKLDWQADVGGKLSPPVAVKDKVYIARVDRHQIVCLREKDGSELWSFTAGARIDSPPTYYRGALLFGCADGRVYCLRAADGKLAWRFQAAPQHRYMVSYNQIESVWPVHGSILVLDGKAYFACGRSSFLDGGIHLYCLDPMSGEVLHHKNVAGPFYNVENTETNYELAQGTLPDILVGDRDSISMRGYRFNTNLTKKTKEKTALTAKGGFLDSTYFQRAYWSIEEPGNYANLLVYDKNNNYMVRMFDNMKLLDPKNYFTPGQDGYEILSQNRETRKMQWSKRIPVRVKAMVLAGDRLVTAGPPDVLDPDDPLGAFEGRKGGVLTLFDAGSGEILSTQELESPPVFNGAIVSGQKLYIAMKNGEFCRFGASN